MSTKYSRKAMMAQLHIAPKDLGMDEDTRRDFIAANCGGKRSSAKLSMSEQFKLLQAFKDAGWKPKRKSGTRKNKTAKYGADSKFGYDEATSRKLIALWRELAGAGKVNDNSAKAMETWIANQTNKKGQQIPKQKSPDTLSGYEVNKLIERLKNWLAR